MWNNLIQEAPEGFDSLFLQWVHKVERQLSIGLADWFPSPVEQVQQYAKVINQRVPKDLELYYRYAYPFGSVKYGWHKWLKRVKEYQAAWSHFLTGTPSKEPNEVRKLVNTASLLWPIRCLGKKGDTVGFVWKGEQIAVIELNLEEQGRGKPISTGLHNYFLVNVVLELLAEEKVEVNFSELSRHPMVLGVSGWPKELPQPKHIALTIGGLQGENDS